MPIAASLSRPKAALNGHQGKDVLNIFECFPCLTVSDLKQTQNLDPGKRFEHSFKEEALLIVYKFIHLTITYYEQV